MSTLKISIFFIGTVFIFTVLIMSCTKEVKIKIPEHEPKIVVNCIFNTDTNIVAYIHKSSAMFEYSNTKIDNAIIKLYENDLFIAQMEYEQNGLYVSDIIANIDREYKIEVFCDGFDMVYSFDFMPEKPKLISAVNIDNLYLDAEDKFPISQLKITLEDNANQKNFYEAKLLIKYIPPGSSNIEIKEVTYRKNSDPILLNENIFDYYPKTILFSDNLFDGKTQTINIDYRRVVHLYNGVYQPYNYDLIVHFRSVSENYFNYKKILYKHLFNQESDIWDGSGDPVQMFTNIYGGYGIFAAYSEIVDTISK